jgi:dTDP-4-dehydrorhamnose 3,5-epimerase
MPLNKTEFPGLYVFEPIVFEDNRGYFFESYNQKIFAAEGLNFSWVQDNQSRSSYGTIRGLHYQLPPHAQTKLVRALSGVILDVVVDLRKGSPTYTKVFSIELSGENKKQMLIPKGFAHGFAVLSETAEFYYKCDEYWNRASEGGIMLNDPRLKIEWKIPADKIIISEKDRLNPPFEQCINNFVFEG